MGENEDSFCDGCGADPIVGHMYTCMVCANYSLCFNCYRSGVHGYEHLPMVGELQREFAVEAVVGQSKQKVPRQAYELLMDNVCKGQIDKFNFLSDWIAGVVLGAKINELNVRGI